MALGLLAGDLKRKEMLSGRLADIHAHLFIITAILQFYQHGSQSEAERLHARVALDNSLYTIQEAFFAFFDNFPNRMAAKLVRFVTFPTGRIFSPVNDELKRELGDVFMADGADNPFRDYLKKMIYYNTKPDDITGRLEGTYQALLGVEPLWQRFKKAEHHGEFAGLSFEDHVVSASQQEFITEEEAEVLIEYNAMRFDSLLTDVFDGQLQHALERPNPHNIDNAVYQLTDYAERKARFQDLVAAATQADAEANQPQTHSGDENPNHGYEPDGDVKTQEEQHAPADAAQQTDFNQSHPDEEALAHRYRDAESTLSERMGRNHSSANNISKQTNKDKQK